jgi:hypothetical protein
MLESHNFESVVFAYICKKQLLKKCKPEFFKNPYISRLFVITQQFHEKFKELPFEFSEDPDLSQLTEIANRNIKSIRFDKEMSEEDSVKFFLNNAKNVLKTDLKKYNEKFLNDTCDAFINWENYLIGMKLAIEYQQSQKINPDNYSGVIKKSKEIIFSHSSLITNLDIGSDFFDHSTHKLLEVKDLVNSGYPSLNKWLSEDEKGGFEPGTLTILVGESNIGKCCHAETKIKVKNKKTGEILEISMEDFYNKLNK